MTIVHYIESYLPLSETFVYNYIVKSSRTFDKVIIVTHYKLANVEEYYKLPKGIKVYCIKDNTLTVKFKRIRNFIDRKTRLFTFFERFYFNLILKYYQPKIVHCHFGTIGVKFMKFQKYFNFQYKYVTSFYGFDISELVIRDRDYSNQLKFLWDHCDNFFGEGPYIVEKIINSGAKREKVFINPIIIDSNNYPKIRHKIKQKCNIIFIGRFTEKKGFHIFLEMFGKAIQKLACVKEDFNITIIGFGELEESYKRIIERYNFADIVDFLGGLPLLKCIEFMKNSDLLVHPSITASNGDSEGGAPTILIEAQMMQLPILSTNHADIPNIMGYSEFLANEGDIDDLEQNFFKFLNSKNLDSITLKGREFVLKNHDLNSSTVYESNLRKIISD
jgi:colanic acid/amylovoran biosynthesis glycosyltransferase